MQTQSSFTRLLVLFMALLFAAAVFIFYSTSKMAGAELVQEFEQREARTLEAVKWLVAGKAPYAGVEQLRAQIKDISAHFDIRVTYVVAGKVLAESDLTPEEAAKMEDHSTRPEIVAAQAEGFGKSTRYSSTLQREMLYMATRVQGLAGIPDGVLRISVPYSTVQGILEQSRSNLMAVTAAMAVCAALLAMLLLRRTKGMLLSFSRIVDDLGSGMAPDKIRVCPGSEFRPLMDSINVLAKRARKSMRHLHDTSSQFEAVLAKMTDAVAVLDDKGTILAHNAALDAVLGASVACSGRHVMEAGLGLEVDKALEEARQSRAHEPQRFQARLINGVHADVDLVPYFTSKGKPRFILVLHDVSAMKNAETLLREFVINASHQLRTPLTSIQGYASTLLESPPSDQAQAQAMLGTILKKSQDMGAVVTDLLHTASPQADRSADSNS